VSVVITGDGSPRSLARVLGLFDALAVADGGLTLTQLSAALDAPKSSLLLLLRPLVSMGYLEHASARYTLGAAVFRMASTILSASRFPRLIRPFMDALVARTRESVFLAVLDREARTVSYVECIESPQAVRYAVPVGTTRALYPSAAGRVLLAFQDEGWRARYLESARIVALTPRTVTDRDALARELRTIRRAGVAITVGEAVDGAAGIAAPIVGSDGTVRFALLVGAPAARFQKALPALRKAVIDVAASASDALGALAD
jgi:IclR family acetate operon transcriptional repressor